jgi:hypothetical protein
MKLTKILGLVALVVVAFFVGFFARPEYNSYHQHQVTSVAKSFVADLVAGNNAAAYAMTSSALQQKQTQDQFSQALGNLKSSNPQYSNENVVVNKAGAGYTVTVGNLPADGVGSTNGIFQLTLVKQSGKWVVDTANVQ